MAKKQGVDKICAKLNTLKSDGAVSRDGVWEEDKEGPDEQTGPVVPPDGPQPPADHDQTTEIALTSYQALKAQIVASLIAGDWRTSSGNGLDRLISAAIDRSEQLMSEIVKKDADRKT